MAYNPFRLGQSHPLFYMEEFIENGIGLVTEEHEAEHQAMYNHWGLKYVNSGPMNGKLIIKNNEDGTIQYTYSNDRAYHLSLHLKFYKETGLFPELVKRYEENVGSLSDVKIPEIHPNDPKGK